MLFGYLSSHRSFRDVLLLGSLLLDGLLGWRSGAVWSLVFGVSIAGVALSFGLGTISGLLNFVFATHWTSTLHLAFRRGRRKVWSIVFMLVILVIIVVQDAAAAVVTIIDFTPRTLPQTITLALMVFASIFSLLPILGGFFLPLITDVIPAEQEQMQKDEVKRRLLRLQRRALKEMEQDGRSGDAWGKLAYFRQQLEQAGDHEALKMLEALHLAAQSGQEADAEAAARHQGNATIREEDTGFEDIAPASLPTSTPQPALPAPVQSDALLALLEKLTHEVARLSGKPLFDKSITADIVAVTPDGTLKSEPPPDPALSELAKLLHQRGIPAEQFVQAARDGKLADLEAQFGAPFAEAALAHLLHHASAASNHQVQ